MLRVLILGGTSDARRLGERLARDRRFEALLSFAGRTAHVADPGVPHRIGGFGGAEGLGAYLRASRQHVIVDATHAFAAQMSRNAARAAAGLGLPLVRLEPPPWQPVTGDRWHVVPSMAAAVAALGTSPRRVLSTVGRLEVEAFRAAPQHAYIFRAVDAFEPPVSNARVIAARGPFSLAEERALLEREAIDVLVSKNSGTPSTYPKLAAARQLGVPVVMVARPSLPEVETVPDVEAALNWLCAAHEASSMKRGV